MALYDNKFMDYYNYLFIELADERTNDWPLIKSPVPGLTIMSAYLYFVLSWGPKYMSNRKPLKLSRILIVYNFIQVIVSTYIFVEGMQGTFLLKYNWRCQPVNFTNTPQGLREARGVYIYFLAKISELLDTVFFVLRKKDRQISFLHMYHHTVMPMISWGATKYYPGGHGIFIGIINSFVHIIMYAYYLFAAMGPQYQKYLWWKKYITNLQMLQFCIAFLHSAQLLYTDCGYPRWSVYFTLPNAIFFYMLFNNFYKQSYKNKLAAAAALKAEQAEKAEKAEKAMNGIVNKCLPQNGAASLYATPPDNNNNHIIHDDNNNNIIHDDNNNNIIIKEHKKDK